MIETNYGMSLVVKRYKKLVKELLFAYSELEYVDEVLKEAHVDFEIFYQDYCKKNNFPIQELNQKNATKLEKVYPKNEIKTNEAGIISTKRAKKKRKITNFFKECIE